MGMKNFAGETGASIQTDWTTAPFLMLPKERGQSVDLVIRGVDKARSDNKFNRAVGEKTARSVPPFVECDVLLCELADRPDSVRVAVRGAGLVNVLKRSTGLGDWPRAADAPFSDETRPAAVMLKAPQLVTITCQGEKDADTGHFTVYTVERVMTDEPEEFIQGYRASMARKIRAVDPVETTDDADRIPF